MEIPAQVREVAKGLGTNIEYLGIYEGKRIFSVFTITAEGIGVETGMPILVYYDGNSAKVKIDGSNFQVLDALNVS